VFGSFGTIC